MNKTSDMRCPFLIPEYQVVKTSSVSITSSVVQLKYFVAQNMEEFFFKDYKFHFGENRKIIIY